MCEFCVKHGEGKKWYLEAKNYSDDLLHDLKRKRSLEALFSSAQAQADPKEGLRRLDRVPEFVRRALAWGVTRKMKKVHFGQVLPIEDVERIFGFVNSITRLGCLCRKMNLGQEKRYCYALSLSPGGGLLGMTQGVDLGLGRLESLTRDEALASLRDHETEGLCHTVWTFGTPFIGAICNCDRADCLALSSTVTHEVPVLFRAEYVARVGPELCTGCRSCMKSCQFGALSFSAGAGKTVVDARHCYGCGVCRVSCSKNAITLLDRSSVPEAARLW